MENPYNYFHSNQDPDDFDQHNSSNDRRKFIKKMVVLASGLLSVPMVIFLIIFAVIWHNMSSDFNRRHEDFKAATQKWDKDFQEHVKAVDELSENFHRAFEKNRLESEEQFRKTSKLLDSDQGKMVTDDEWEAMEDDFINKDNLKWKGEEKSNPIQVHKKKSAMKNELPRNNN